MIFVFIIFFMFLSIKWKHNNIIRQFLLQIFFWQSFFCIFWKQISNFSNLQHFTTTKCSNLEPKFCEPSAYKSIVFSSLQKCILSRKHYFFSQKFLSTRKLHPILDGRRCFRKIVRKLFFLKLM